MSHDIPAVAIVLALAGTGLLATGAQAADRTAEQPRPAAAPAPADQPTERELHDRLAGALRAAADGPGTRTSPSPKHSAKPSPKPSAKSSAASSAKPSSGPSARIIGGKPAAITSAPWMAQLYFKDNRGNGYFCGGSVVAPTKIVTAAHCVDGIDFKRTGVIVTGADRAATDTGRKDSAGKPIMNVYGGEARGAVRQWQHPKYDDYTLDNDVAVLTLTSPVKAKPLQIMKSGDTGLYKAGTDGKVYGWGLTSTRPDASGSDRLKVADADAQSDANCKKAYGWEFIAGTMYCAGRAPTGKDSTSETTCNGDSGGPLVAGGRLVGVVSWGDANCSAKGKYGVYAKVSAFQSALRARVHDTSWNGDQYADLLARSGDKLYPWTAKGKALTRGKELPGFAGVNLLVQSDLNRDGRQDLIRRTAAGEAYWSQGSAAPRPLSTGWRSHKQILAPGDLTGDDLPDVMVVTSGGNGYLYPGKGDGSLAPSVKVGAGWRDYTMVRGHGDFTGDGKADVLGHVFGGKMYLHKGTGDARKPFAARVQIGTHSGLNALATTGDVNGDGNPDLLARDMKGKLWLYPGTGKSSGILGKRAQYASGLGGYNLFG
ncbi:trypsin-like serine protease [Streptomyces sp. NPDC014894]|uniref:trypsin-like serine protease n=1 Tax=Streptomyces sp. NPDC014894 TaxID=3364931 RepID=UPI0036F8590F